MQARVQGFPIQRMQTRVPFSDPTRVPGSLIQRMQARVQGSPIQRMQTRVQGFPIQRMQTRVLVLRSNECKQEYRVLGSSAA